MTKQLDDDWTETFERLQTSSDVCGTTAAIQRPPSAALLPAVKEAPHFLRGMRRKKFE